MSASCPNCHSSFTISEEEQVAVTATPGMPPPAAPAPTRERVAVATETQPSPVLDETQPNRPARVAPEPAQTAPLGEVGEPALAPALIALTIGGLALASSQLPYGRILITALASMGLLMALFTVLFAERERLYPILATVTNAIALSLALWLPTWLGLSTFLPETPPDPTSEVRAIDFLQGVAIPASDRVDAQRLSWTKDDVLISIPAVSYAPVDLVGPNNQKRRTRERVLQLTVKIANAGVARAIDFKGWQPPTNMIKLTDSTGNLLKPKTFERGWNPDTPATVATTLFPGKSAEQTFYFEPIRFSGELNLELPAEAFQGTEPARFTIPISMIAQR